jgi:hypothetical protein
LVLLGVCYIISLAKKKLYPYICLSSFST